jgi:hypothetical protein
VPTGWYSTINNARQDWNGIPGSSFAYYYPAFGNDNPNAEHKVIYADFSALGLPHVPGATLLVRHPVVGTLSLATISTAITPGILLVSSAHL